MKKIFFTSIAILVLAATAGAQTMSDALTFSQNNYYGTARSMALGNAMTAVGGDLGSIGLNPAGSAIARYNQFSVTPGYNISSNNSFFSSSNFTVLADDGTYRTSESGSFGPAFNERNKGMTLPNMGFSFVFSTGQSRGLKSMSVAMLSSHTNIHRDRFVATGTNDCTSMLGYFASQATFNCDGFGSFEDPHTLDPMVFDNYDDPYNFFSRDPIAAYDSYMISPESNGGYVGATQNMGKGSSALDYPNSGPIKQKAIVQKQGSKHDFLFNVAMNFDDKWFVGVNLGLPVFSYSNTEFFAESAIDPEQFPVPITDADGKTNIYNFQSSEYTYDYWASGEGIYAKIGLIYLPNDNLRFGLSLQTPTAYNIDENWTIAASTNISGTRHEASGVPEWGSSYKMRSPGIVDFGAAWTFGGKGFISADYELVDYSAMKYTMPGYEFSAYDPFEIVNKLTSIFCGASHSLRLGGEYRLTPAFSLRAGYNVTTSPLKMYRDSEGDLVDAEMYDANYDYYEAGYATLGGGRHFKAPVRAFSFGLGWSSAGSFFADAAFKATRYPVSYYSPYPVYQTFDGGGHFTASPLVQSTRTLFDIALTLGWRF